MVILPSLKKVFIHIPRTSGTALSHALTKAFPDSVYRNGYRDHHTTAQQAKIQFPDFETFTILRTPTDIFRSHYGWILRNAENLRDGWEPWFRTAILESSRRTLDGQSLHCLENNILCGSMGFWGTYCLPETKVFLYEDWPYHHIEHYLTRELDVRAENQTLHALLPLSQKVQVAIEERCQLDYQKFYQ